MVELVERLDARTVEEPLLFKVEQAVRVTNCSRSVLYQEIAAGRLRAVKIGRSLRIRRDDLLRWIEAQPDAA